MDSPIISHVLGVVHKLRHAWQGGGGGGGGGQIEETFRARRSREQQKLSVTRAQNTLKVSEQREKTAGRAETRGKVSVTKGVGGVVWGKSESKKGRVTRDGIYERPLMSQPTQRLCERMLRNIPEES